MFQKTRGIINMCKILDYGIFHGIFLEYSKKYITTLGGVKFNQGIYLMDGGKDGRKKGKKGIRNNFSFFLILICHLFNL